MTTADEKLVTLTTASSEWQADLMVATLKDAGIAASTAGGLLSGLRAETPVYATVMVRASDVLKAREALIAAKVRSESVDWDAQDIGDERPDSAEAKDEPKSFSVGVLVGLVLIVCGALLVMTVARSPGSTGRKPAPVAVP